MRGTDFDLCVIGGGSGGLVVAAGGAALGAKVALIEKNRLGGDCLWSGCVPSKALLHTANIAQRMRTANTCGLSSHDPAVDLAAVMAHVRDVIGAIEPHDSPERFRAMGIEVIFGAGRFRDRRCFEIDGRSLTARHFVVATGSRPAVPPLPGLDGIPYLTNENVFDLRVPVPELIVLGGGPVGVELAQAFVRLGSRVHLIERGPQLLPAEDRDVAAVVEHSLRREGVQFYLDSEAVRVTYDAGIVRLFAKNAADTEHAIAGTHLLIATGRRANSEALGLDAAGVRRDARGHIATDERLRTSARHIYACGDVTGRHLFTHVAEHHAGVILRNALFRLPAKIERRVVPWCTYSDPEVARVGLSEREARQRGVAHEVHTFPFHGIDRAHTDGATVGHAKTLTDRTGRLLGAALVGPRAGELIHEYVLALTHHIHARDLSKTMHIYPTLSQINRRVADEHMKARLTPAAKKWIKRLFRLRGGQA